MFLNYLIFLEIVFILKVKVNLILKPKNNEQLVLLLINRCNKNLNIRSYTALKLKQKKKIL